MASTSSLLSFLSPLFPSNIRQHSSLPSPSLPTPKFPLPNSISLSPKHKNGVLGPLMASKNEYPDDLMTVMNPDSDIDFDSDFEGCNVEVTVEENEPIERLVNRFRRDVLRAGILQECRRRRFCENKQEKRKRKETEAFKRRRRRFQSGQFQNRDEDPVVEKTDDDDDDGNWEMPEGDVPF